MRSKIDAFVRMSVTRLAMVIANPYTFISVLIICAAWIIYGAMIGFTDQWRAITEVTLAFGTFITVFIVQFSEETDTTAAQDKLDELISATEGADKSLVEKEKEYKKDTE